MKTLVEIIVATVYGKIITPVLNLFRKKKENG